MKLLIVAVPLMMCFLTVKAKDDFLTPEEIEELKRRLAVVRDETLAEARSIVDVRKKEAGVGTSELNICVDQASANLEDGVVNALQDMIGSLQQELNDGHPLEREKFKAKVEIATVGAGVAVEDYTTKFIKKIFSCTRDEFARNVGEEDKQ